MLDIALSSKSIPCQFLDNCDRMLCFKVPGAFQDQTLYTNIGYSQNVRKRFPKISKEKLTLRTLSVLAPAITAEDVLRICQRDRLKNSINLLAFHPA